MATLTKRHFSNKDGIIWQMDCPYRKGATVEPLSQDRWSLVTGSMMLKCGTFCQKYVLIQVSVMQLNLPPKAMP